MKKFFTLLAIVAFTTSLAANAAESKIQNYVDNLISPITKKEKQINSQAEAQKKANAQKKAELKKKKEAQKAAAKKQQEQAKAKRDNTKKAVNDEVSFWKSLFSRK